MFVELFVVESSVSLSVRVSVWVLFHVVCPSVHPSAHPSVLPFGGGSVFSRGGCVPGLVVGCALTGFM